MDSPAETPLMGGAPQATAHFCRAPTEAELESWRQHWRQQYEAEHPRQPPPLMANMALALDLSGDGVRDYPFHGTTYRLRPTPYPSAIRLLQVSERLGTLEALGQLIEEEQLLALRECFVTIAELAGELLLPSPGANPFLVQGEMPDFAALLQFLIDPGNEIRPDDRGEGTPQRYDAAHHLMAYRAVYGMPETWREFCAGCRCIRRQEAERAIQLYGTMAMAQWGDQDGREQWLDAQRREAR